MTYQICTRCITDTSVPGVKFDDRGECSYCKLHDKMAAQFPNDERGEKIIVEATDRMRRDGRRKKYDCIVGVSGGRDSIYTTYLLKKKYGLRPLAVHFNDGFGNPTAGKNMIKCTAKLGVELRTITSDWRESKDLKVAFLKASTPELEEGTDLGIGAALYGVANQAGVKHVVFGQSFRTEGMAPLEWSYLDGKYLRSVHKIYGTVPLKKWKPSEPGFNLELQHLFYYIVLKRIKLFPILYYARYVRSEAEKIITEELGWENTGAHYFDDLYQSLMTRVFREKFNMDRRRFNYSALIRSGQMTRDEAMSRVKEIYVIEDPKVIDLCIKRLGLTKEEFEQMVNQPPKTFRDYPNSYDIIRKFRVPLKMLVSLKLLPGTVYDKYFESV